MSEPLEPVKIYVGLGGNVGDEDALQGRLASAADAVAKLPYAFSLTRSSLYLTAPQGPFRDQQPFMNAVIGFGRGRDVDPVAVLADLLAIEAGLGRERGREEPLGPRPIDLDLLLCGSRVLRSQGPPATEVPHPKLGERAFALEPLAEVAGYQLCIPGTRTTIGERLSDPMIRAQPISRLGAPW